MNLDPLHWEHGVPTTRPLRYDLTQIPSDYTVEVTNRFKGLDLIDRVPEELWTEAHDSVQEMVTKTIPKKKKCKKATLLSEEALQIAEKEEKQKARKKEKDKIGDITGTFHAKMGMTKIESVRI